MGEYYFKKLVPNGAISLAFAHGSCFDKEESTAGLRVSLRPELKAVFRLAPKVKHLDIPAILELPDEERREHPTVQPKEALGYLVTIPIMNKLLPGLLPCRGKLTKDGSRIKSWDRFKAIADKKDHRLFTDSQIELNLAGDYLWKMVEKTADYIMQEDTKKEKLNKLTDIFDIWKEIFPVLKKQPYVYVYTLYGTSELSGRPAKNRIQRIVLSEQAPALKFALMDKGHFYQFRMEVWLKGKRLYGYDARASFFIIHKDVMYICFGL